MPIYKLGARAHDYHADDLETLFENIANDGWTGIQLAFKKAIPGVQSYEDVSEELVERTRIALAKNALEVPVLGVYVDLGQKDEAKRKEAVRQFISQLWVCKALGAGCIGSETTNWNKQPEGTTREEGIAQVIRSMQEILPEAEKLGVFVALEAGYEHTMNTPERVKQVLDAVPSANLKTIFDPANLLGPEWLTDQTALYTKAMELYGDRILCVHFKGVRFEGEKRFSCLLEDSQVDYSAAARAMEHLPQKCIPVSREEAVPDRAQSDQTFMARFFPSSK